MLDPQIHESGAKLLFSNEEEGLSSFFAVVSAFDNALGNEETFTAVGDEWRLNHEEEKVKYWEGKIKTREQDSGEAYYEYQIGVVAQDPVGRKRVNFQFRPALPNSTHVETGEPIQSLPRDLPLGTRVQIDAANLDPLEAVDVLQELADHIGISPDYFSREYIHDWSRVYNLATYVRIEREKARQHLTDRGGLLERLAHLQSRRAGQGRYEWDNEQIIGHRNAVALNETGLAKLYGEGEDEPEHTVGKLLKSYHMADPSAQEGYATEHSKLEVQYSSTFSQEGSQPWSRVEELTEELTRYLLNCLQWANLPLEPDPRVYKPDQYWTPSERDEELALQEDRVDVAREEQEDAATRALLESDASETQLAVLETLISDGGEAHYEDLADQADVSTSTVYRVVDSFSSILEQVKGKIRTADEVVYDRLNGLLETLSRSSSRASDALRSLAKGGDPGPLEDSALAAWIERHGIRASRTQEWGEDELILRLQAGELSESEAAKIIRAGYVTAERVSSHARMLLEEATVRFNRSDGKRVERAAIRFQSGWDPHALGILPCRAAEPPP